MTPAEGLRAAARLIRETAAGATPGPWHIRDGNKTSSNVADHDEHMVIDGGGWTDGTKAVVYGAALTADAAWIALAGPQLAEPLAGILDGAAALIGQHPDLAREHIDGEPCGSPHCQIVTHALAVARAVLGSAR